MFRVNRWGAIVGAGLLYVGVVIAASAWTYWRARSAAMDGIDRQLLVGASAVRHVLPDDFHDRATGPGRIPADEDESNIRGLTSMARSSGFKFLYSLVRQGDMVFITSSSATEEEMAKNSEVRCFDSYAEAVPFTAEAFASTGVVFRTYTDRWGVFRAAYLPEMSPGGNRWVAGADLDIGFVQSLLRQRLGESIAVALALLLSSLPIFVIFLRKERRHAASLEAANAELNREIRERKDVERQLIQAHKLEAIGTLAGGVAHDFNNILTSIIGHAELAAQDIDRHSAAARDIEDIRLAAGRASELTRRILSFARKGKGEVKAVRVADVAHEVVGLVQTTLPRSVTVQTRLECDACVLADPTSLHQILMNLCTNGVQAMARAGGVLTVEVAEVTLDTEEAARRRGLRPGNYVRVSVRDTGIGIAPEIMDSIFEPYFTTKAQGQGTGLGLAVVLGLVKSHGGDIVVESHPGAGASFTVLLPRVAPETAPGEAAAETRSVDELPRGTERVMVVDDEPSVVRSTTRMLERLGYRVTSFSDSPHALEAFVADPHGFDLVLTDLIMPTMTGDKLAEAILRVRPGLPVILYTGYIQKIRASTIEEIGISLLMLKPFSLRDLAFGVRSALESARTPGADAEPSP